MINGTIQDKLLKSFKIFKNNTAIEYGDLSVSYEELRSKSDVVAHSILSDKYYKKESFIGILLEDKVDYISTLLGILKAGCIFVPFDLAQPLKRIADMTESIVLKYIITDRKNRDKINQSEYILLTEQIMNIEDIHKNTTCCMEQICYNYQPEDSIYVYFTSGTTGAPKAILGKNVSLLHFVEWEIETFEIGENTRVSNITTPGFDAMLRDVFTPLCSGGTICIPKERKIVLDGKAFSDWINQSKINLLHCTPSIFNNIKPDYLKETDFLELKNILMAGEQINVKALSEWYQVFGERIQLVNLYGASETTMIKLYHCIKPSDLDMERIPAGVPIKGAKAVILDSDLNPCRTGDIGEIYIRTPYMTKGYLNDDELTKTHFIINPFRNDKNDLIYKTGDLGKVLADGNIVILGRADRQVKIRGVRVELNEIENVMLQCDNINACVVQTYQMDTQGDMSIAAYYVSDKEIQTVDIQNYLSKILPEYMIPGFILKIDQIPITLNGKIDYKSLPHPKSIISAAYEAPKSGIEKKLADIWCSLMNREEVGIHDNFMQIGGNSLNIMTMITMIFEEFEVELPLAAIFENPTIKNLSCYLDNYMKKQMIPELGQLLIPKEALSNKQTIEGTYSMKFELDAQLEIKLKKIESNNNVQSKHILFSIFQYLLYEFTKEDRIPIHAMTEKNGQLCISVTNIENVDDIYDLIKQAKITLENNNTFSPQEIISSYRARELEHIIPFFGDKTVCNNLLYELKSYYELSLFYESTDNGYIIELLYNGRFDEQYMEKFLSGYIKLLEIIK